MGKQALFLVGEVDHYDHFKLGEVGLKADEVGYYNHFKVNEICSKLYWMRNQIMTTSRLEQ